MICALAKGGSRDTNYTYQLWLIFNYKHIFEVISFLKTHNSSECSTIPGLLGEMENKFRM